DVSRQDRRTCARPPHGTPVKNAVSYRALGPLERPGELRARADGELAEDAAEVSLDGVLREEEALRDLPVRQSLGRHTSDAELGGGETPAAFDGVSAWARSGCDELVVGTCKIGRASCRERVE